MNLQDQYDRIFKYLYYRLHDRQQAEDLTQETFLRFLGSRTYRDEDRQLQYLYTIARNLCSQHFRDRTFTYSLDEAMDHPKICPAPEGMTDPQMTDGFEQSLLQRITLNSALEKLPSQEREMVFLRYVNDVPIPVMSGLYHISRFAMYRKLRRILKKLRQEMESERPDVKDQRKGAGHT